MATQNVQDLINNLAELTRTGQDTDEAFRQLIETTDDTTTGLEKVGNVAISGAKGLNDFTKQVAGGDGALNSMNGAITQLSSALGDVLGPLGGLATGAGAVLTFAIDRMQASFTAFQELADAGAIGAEGISGLREDFDKAGIPLEKYSAMLKTNAEDLGFIYGTTLKGSEQFADTMAKMNEKGNMELRLMGFTVEDVGKTVVNFQKLQRKMGFDQQLSADDLAKASTRYGTELDALAKLTGQSKDSLQGQRDEMMRDSRFRATMQNELSKNADANITGLMNLTTILKKEAPGLAKGFQDLASGFISTDEAIKASVSGYGPVFRQVSKQILDGSLSVTEGFNLIQQSAKTNVKWQEKIALAAGDSTGSLANYADQLDLVVRGVMTPEQSKAIVEAQLNLQRGTDENTKSLVYANQSLLESAVNLDMLATSGNFASKTISMFASTMLTATDAIRKLLDMPSTSIEQSDSAFANASLEVAKKELANTEKELADAKKYGEDEDVIRKLEDLVIEKDTQLTQSKALKDFAETSLGQSQNLIKEISQLSARIEINSRLKKGTDQNYKSDVRSIEKDESLTDDVRKNRLTRAKDAYTQEMKNIDETLLKSEQSLKRKKNALLVNELEAGVKTIEMVNKEREVKLKKLEVYTKQQETIFKNANVSEEKYKELLNMQVNTFKKNLDIPAIPKNYKLNQEKTKVPVKTKVETQTEKPKQEIEQAKIQTEKSTAPPKVTTPDEKTIINEKNNKDKENYNGTIKILSSIQATLEKNSKETANAFEGFKDSTFQVAKKMDEQVKATRELTGVTANNGMIASN